MILLHLAKRVEVSKEIVQLDVLFVICNLCTQEQITLLNLSVCTWKILTSSAECLSGLKVNLIISDKTHQLTNLWNSSSIILTQESFREIGRSVRRMRAIV